jgi:retron-type reverse transcriptase
MYFSPCRRRGTRGVAGARDRRGSADCHSGSFRTVLRRHEQEARAAARGDRPTRQALVGRLLRRTADTRILRLSYDRLAADGGQAPGLDGLRYDLEDHEVWQLVRALSRAIRDGTYRAGPDRKLAIPKASGRGTRTLLIPAVGDRVVQKAIAMTLGPFLDEYLSDSALAYRPGSDTNRALALAERLAVTNDSRAVISEDLRNAFDTVPQKRLLDIVGTHVTDGPMMNLLARVVLTDTGRGIRQGGNLSPLLLNVYLDHTLDRRWRKLQPDVPLLRWADDLLILCRTREQALQAYTSLEDLLRPTGMELKHGPEKAVHDLTGLGADWLGYRVTRKEDGLVITLTERAWESLSALLEQAHQKDGSPVRAIEALDGWVGQMGPCYRDTDIDRAYARIRSLFLRLDFDEFPSKEGIRRKWQWAHRRWLTSRTVGNEQEVMHAAQPCWTAPAPPTGAGPAS